MCSTRVPRGALRDRPPSARHWTRSPQYIERLPPQRLGGGRHHAAVGSRAERFAAPVADPAAGARYDGNDGHEVVRLQVRFDHQLAEPAGKHAVEVTVAAKAAQRSARAERIKTRPLRRVERVRAGGIENRLPERAAVSGPRGLTVEERRTPIGADPALTDHRCLDHAEHRAVPLLERNQRAEQWIAA